MHGNCISFFFRIIKTHLNFNGGQVCLPTAENIFSLQIFILFTHKQVQRQTVNKDHMKCRLRWHSLGFALFAKIKTIFID